MFTMNVNFYFSPSVTIIVKLFLAAITAIGTIKFPELFFMFVNRPLFQIKVGCCRFTGLYY